MNRAAFYDAIRPMFGGKISQKQIDGCEAILAYAQGRPVSHKAFYLGTAFLETAQSMQPIKETVMPHHKDKNPSDATVVNRLERAWKAGKLNQVKTPYWRFDARGFTWFGRGLVQITHRDNYMRASALTGVDLLTDPNRALNPQVAAKILIEGSDTGLFTHGKHKTSDHLPGSYREARRIINGTDKAAEFERYCKAFEAALVAAGVSVAKTAPSPSPAKKPGVAGPLVAGGTVAAGAAWAWACKIPWLASFFSSCGG